MNSAELLKQSPSLQLYGMYHDDQQAASLEDFLGELDDWHDTTYASRAWELRYDAALEAVKLAHQVPCRKFGFVAYGTVEDNGRAEVIVYDPIGTRAFFDTGIAHKDEDVALHLARVWEEWE
jgi:hypothetical protein